VGNVSSKELNLNIGIDTVGYNLNKNFINKNFINKNLQYIGLPLDSTDSVIQCKMRNYNYDFLEKFDYNVQLLNTYNIPIKINTVVSKFNLYALNQLGEYIMQNCDNVYWSIYQWSPINSSYLSRKIFEISIDDFNEAIYKVKNFFPNLSIHSKNNFERGFNHILIQNDGTVITFGSFHKEVFYIGNIIKDDLKNIVSSPLIKKDSSKMKLSCRFKN
jgi:hypothetical protein